MERWLRIRLGVLVALSVVGLLVWIPAGQASSSIGENLQVRFLDVGQGDAIQIITPDGYEALIDGGPTASVLRELAIGRSFFDKSIDVLIATHPDSDHISGLVDVLERYQVDYIIETNNKSETAASSAYEQAVTNEQAKIIIAQAGQTIKLGGLTTIKIYSPNGDTSNWKSNAASVVVQVSFGDIDFMLTGDAPSSIEDYIVSKYGTLLESEVLKLGHHGSDTSSSENFLNTVKPDFAVVSAGADNRYGHPRAEVIERAESVGAEIVSTIDKGTITFVTDGKKVWVE
ncbi:MBL fold metallo-hydrolase [Candidatus Nomurabacteria bacterium]|nr:MBL fold metallo-hydrolase [Candidatus Kaiserbacteria bacterium]MCB9814609.1 MBL fold metallo-hydrolase [Candidatus Nomurabacteria bacterium]